MPLSAALGPHATASCVQLRDVLELFLVVRSGVGGRAGKTWQMFVNHRVTNAMKNFEVSHFEISSRDTFSSLGS